jgi:putative glutamine amidotransferase
MKLTLLSIITLIFFTISSCNTDTPTIANQSRTVRIAISKAHGSTGYLQYKKWLLSIDSTIIINDLYGLSLDSALRIISTSDALLISGGPDVNPSRYSYDSMAYICEKPDNYRDSLEFQSIEYAFNNKLPILGICRGQQILNVYFGGTLITDIPSQHPSSINHRIDNEKCYHSISIIPESFLYKIYKTDTISVNSAHHQAVENLGKHLQVFAYSKDSIIESIGFEESIYQNFFLGVQFHPEYLIGKEISYSIGESFIESARNTKN